MYDSSETIDSDGDGFGDNSDVFPNDPSEWYDTDNDTYGDNALVLLSQKFDFKIPVARPLIEEWMDMATNVDDLNQEICIAMVGKYTGLSDSYLSVIKALNHASIAASRKLNIECYFEKIVRKLNTECYFEN